MNHLYVPIKDPVICYHNTQKIFSRSDYLNYHRHDACEIFILLEGRATFYVEHSCYELTRGDMMILSPDELHRSVNKNQADYESWGLNIHETLLRELSSDQTSLLDCFEQRLMGERNLIHLNDLDLSIFLSLFQQISSLLSTPAYGSELLINASLTQLAVKVNQLHARETETSNLMPDLVQDTMHYIKENLTRSVQLKDLEEHLNYNGTYISFCFKQHTGLTIREYILDQRILTAKRYLSAGYSVQETSVMSGFNDYSNFIRSFSKVVGLSPGKFKLKQI